MYTYHIVMDHWLKIKLGGWQIPNNTMITICHLLRYPSKAGYFITSVLMCVSFLCDLLFCCFIICNFVMFFLADHELPVEKYMF